MDVGDKKTKQNKNRKRVVLLPYINQAGRQQEGTGGSSKRE